MYCSQLPDHVGAVDATATWHLPAHDTSAGVARRHVRSFVRGRQCAAPAEDCTLIASELVANAIHHGAGPVWLTLRHLVHDDGSEALQLLVGDHGTGRGPITPVRDPAGGALRISGRGLTIVDALSTAWGSTRIADGHVVWATVRLESRPDARGRATRLRRGLARRA
ncbi:ATP-binding protein [Streptomyces griseochromogenes]|uniref:ATP-binding protein n=1 Tax=Streptomyces griseochromogenes TaxID=68214 RepID=UPI0037B02171